MIKQFAVLFLAFGAACASSKAVAPKTLPTPTTTTTVTATPSDATRTAGAPEPAVEPPIAYMLGLMPLKSTGVDLFRSLHPTYDGRGVLIAILDSGVDPNVAGLLTTSTGSPKVIELRDFSGRGASP